MAALPSFDCLLTSLLLAAHCRAPGSTHKLDEAGALNCSCVATITACVESMGIGENAPAVVVAWCQHLKAQATAQQELTAEAYRERGTTPRNQVVAPILPSTLVPFENLLALWGPRDAFVAESIAFAPPGVPAEAGYLICLYMSCACTFSGCATSPQAIKDDQKATFACTALPALRGILADALAGQEQLQRLSAAGSDSPLVLLMQAWRVRLLAAALHACIYLHAVHTPVQRAAVLEMLPSLHALLRSGSCGCPGRLCVNSGAAVARIRTPAVSWVPAAREMMALLAAWLPRAGGYAAQPLAEGAEVLSFEEALFLVGHALDLMQELALHHVCMPGLTQQHDHGAATSVAATLKGALWMGQGDLKVRGFAALFERTKALLTQLHPFRSPHAIRMYADLAVQTVCPAVYGDDDVAALHIFLNAGMLDAFGPILQLLAPPGEVHPDIAAMLVTLAATLDAERGNRVRANRGSLPVDEAVALLRGAVSKPFHVVEEIVTRHTGKRPQGFSSHIKLPPPVLQQLLTALLVGPFAERVWQPYARAQGAQAHRRPDWRDPTAAFALEVACLAVEAATDGVLPRHGDLLHSVVRLLSFGLADVRDKPEGVAAQPYIKQLIGMLDASPPSRMDDATWSAFAALQSQVDSTFSQTSLLRCAWMDDADGVRRSVEAGADPDATPYVHALVAAAAVGSAHAVQALLTPPVVRAGAARQEKVTALQCACVYGHVQALRAMIDTGMVAALAAEMPHHQQSTLSALALHAYGTDTAAVLGAAGLPVLPDPPVVVLSASTPAVRESMPALSTLQAACLCGDAAAALEVAISCRDDWSALCAPATGFANVCAPLSPLVLVIVSDSPDVMSALLTLRAVRAHINDALPIGGDNWRPLDFAVISRSANASIIVEQLLAAGATADQQAWQLWSDNNSSQLDIGRLLCAASAAPPRLQTHVSLHDSSVCLLPLCVRLEMLLSWREQAAVIASVTAPGQDDVLPTVRAVLSASAHYTRRKHALRHRMWATYAARVSAGATSSTRPRTALLHCTAADIPVRLRFGVLRVLSMCKSRAACTVAFSNPHALMLSLPPNRAQCNPQSHGRTRNLDTPASMGVPRASALLECEQLVPLARVWRYVHVATGTAVARTWMAVISLDRTLPLSGMLAMDCTALAQTRLHAARAAPAQLMGQCIRFMTTLIAVNPSFIAAPCARELMRMLAESLPDVVTTYADFHDYDVTSFLPVFAAGDATVRDVLLYHLTSAHSSEEVADAALEALGALAHSDEHTRGIFSEHVCRIATLASLQPTHAAKEAIRRLHMLMQRAGWAPQVDGMFGPKINAWTTQVPTGVRSRVLASMFELRQRTRPSPAAVTLPSASIMPLTELPPDAPICTGTRLRMPCHACGRAMFALVDVDLTDGRMAELRTLLGGERCRLIFPYCGACNRAIMQDFGCYDVVFQEGGGSDWEAGTAARPRDDDEDADDAEGKVDDDQPAAARGVEASSSGLDASPPSQPVYRSHKLGAAMQPWALTTENGDEYPQNYLGGRPHWPQDDEYVHCSRCREEMVYIARVSAYQMGLHNDPDTHVHFYVCATCRLRGAVQVLAPA